MPESSEAGRAVVDGYMTHGQRLEITERAT